MMQPSRLPFAAFVVTVVGGALLAGAAIAAAQAEPAVPQSIGSATAKPIVKVDQGKVARAARSAARIKLGEVSWSAFTAARHEPSVVFKGITLTSSARSATHVIRENYLDHFEDLDRADKIAYYTAIDTSTIMSDIATMRLKQRAELRATLTKVQRSRFDSNVVALVAKEGAA